MGKLKSFDERLHLTTDWTILLADAIRNTTFSTFNGTT